tara:strand:+ start:58 stop:414 length:357 start_codon:yes stop_codon:yes gene_type:complete
MNNYEKHAIIGDKMWIGMNDGWISIVENFDDEDYLLVRSRKLDHLTGTFPSCAHFHDPHADYPFRAFIPREDVSQALAEKISSIDYPNFKGSVEDGHLLRAYHLVWSAIYDSFRIFRD